MTEIGCSEPLRSSQALRSALGESDMMAYLVMMAARLSEMRRVLKPKTPGALDLHCDPTASHYLKVVLDGLFDADNFRNEIIWRRTRAHNDKKIRRFGSIHDTIFFYSKSKDWRFNVQYMKRDENAPKTHDLYMHTEVKALLARVIAERLATGVRVMIGTATVCHSALSRQRSVIG